MTSGVKRAKKTSIIMFIITYKFPVSYITMSLSADHDIDMDVADIGPVQKTRVQSKTWRTNV